MARHKDASWKLNEPTRTWDEVHAAILMDIRDELKETNRHLYAIECLVRCTNVSRGFIAMNKIRLHLEAVLPRPKKEK